MRKVLLTGGTGLIGFTLVKSMLTDGHSVVFTTRDKVKAEQLLKSEELYSDRVLIIEVDFNSTDAIEKILTEIPRDVDLVIYNARSVDNLKLDQQGRISESQFQNELYMAITFPYLLTNAIINKTELLRDIVFISSMYGAVAPNPSLYDDFERQSPINYGVAKAAQIHLAKELAVRLANRNIRCNCISYGGVEGRADEAFKQRYAALNPMGRMLKQSDLFPPLKYILDNKDLLITGENLKVDGGWTLW